MTGLWLVRARLRRDAQVAALAPLLLPEDDDARALAAHRLVWSLMPPDPGARRDHLWREEAPGAFMVLCRRPPGPSPLFNIDCRTFEPLLAAGDRLSFVLRANPTVSHAGPGLRSHRSDVVMDALYSLPPGQRAAERQALLQSAGMAWLTRTGERLGFAPDPPKVTADGYHTLRISRQGARPIQFGRVDFTGELTVQEPALFLTALAEGIGRARAFGCGLMLIRRI